MINPKVPTIVTVKNAGIKISKDLATPGGTWSGILIFNASIFLKNPKISNAIIPTIKAVNRPVAPV